MVTQIQIRIIIIRIIEYLGTDLCCQYSFACALAIWWNRVQIVTWTGTSRVDFGQEQDAPARPRPDRGADTGRLGAPDEQTAGPRNPSWGPIARSLRPNSGRTTARRAADGLRAAVRRQEALSTKSAQAPVNHIAAMTIWSGPFSTVSDALS